MALSDIAGVVTVCQGPPVCMLEGDEAVAAQKGGCPWCERITVFEDGSEERTGPHNDVRSMPLS